jgi:beta-galactosidase
VNGSQVPGNVADPAFDDRAWDEIDVPGVWQIKGYGTPYYYATSYPQAIGTKKKRIPKISHGLQEVGIYRRRFMLPNGMADKVVYLHFGAAKAALEVYVNGIYVGYSL